MRSNPRQHHPALDGLRAIAVLLVLLAHTMPGLFLWGWLGVQIFFVLSGFLITGILVDSRDRPTKYRDFYIRRALRIFPLYYIVLAIGAIFSSQAGHPRHFWLWFVYLQNFAWYLPGMRGFSDVLSSHGHYFGAVGHFWSLAIEEQFYLIWPFLVFRFSSRRALLQLCGFGIGGRLMLGVALQHWAPQEWLHLGLIYRMLPTQIDGFLMGAVLAVWIRTPATTQHHLRRLAATAPIAICGYGVLLVLLFLLPLRSMPAKDNVLTYQSGFQGTFGMPLANFVSVLVIAAALVPGTGIYRLCSLRLLRNLGLISYGFYILHLCVFAAIGAFLHEKTATWPLFHSGIWDAVIVFVVTAAIAYASYRWVESPFLRLKDRFAPSHTSTPSGREPALVA